MRDGNKRTQGNKLIRKPQELPKLIRRISFNQKHLLLLFLFFDFSRPQQRTTIQTFRLSTPLAIKVQPTAL